MDINKTPSPHDAERCLRLRKASKSGSHVSLEDMNFCHMMWRKYPEWYKKTQAQAFNETVPFGSNVRMEEDES